jgi:hypothetical protein
MHPKTGFCQRRRGRCPSVGGSAGQQRRSRGRRVTVPTWGRCVQRRSRSLSDSSHGPAVHDSATPILLPMLLPRGDSEATCVVGPVGPVFRLPRDAAAGAREDPPSPRPSVARLRRAGCERSRALLPQRTAGSRGTFAAYGASPSLVSHLVSHHVVPRPIRVDSRHSWAAFLCPHFSVSAVSISAFSSDVPDERSRGGRGATAGPSARLRCLRDSSCGRHDRP